MNVMKNKFSASGDAPSAPTLQPFNASAPGSRAFTLVELLIVIAVIGVLAALLMPVFNSVVNHSVLNRSQSEMQVIETALDRYKTAYGFYPPGNPAATSANLAPALTNQLYFELVGTTNIGTAASPDYLTLDNRITNNNPLQAFGVSGFMNCSRAAGGEDSRAAESFLTGLKSSQIANVPAGSGVVSVLVTAANGDASYTPLPGVTANDGHIANPWRYMYPGVHNPNSYDLWVQVEVGGKTNLICNWNSQPQNNPAIP